MSKFSAALLSAKERGEAESAAQPAMVRTIPERPTPAIPPPPPPPTRGRPAGKRSSTTTVQVTAYIEQATHSATKIQLIKNAGAGKRQDFSGLIQALLTEWLATQKS